MDAGQENSAFTSSLAQNQHGRYSKTCPSSECDMIEEIADAMK
jgi:hypothetical protein